MKRLTTHLLSIIATVVAIIAFASILTSKTVRAWASSHSTWVYGGLVVTVLAVVVLLDYALDLNRKYCALKTSTNEVSEHDKRLLREILLQIPLGGATMMWLRNDFFVKSIPSRQIDAVERAYEKLSLNPIGFDNARVNSAYGNLRTTIEAFSVTITQWTMLEDNNYDTLRVPLSMKERDEGRYYAALEIIKEAVTNLVAAYDDFLMTCQTNGMSIYPPEPAS